MEFNFIKNLLSQACCVILIRLNNLISWISIIFDVLNITEGYKA